MLQSPSKHPSLPQWWNLCLLMREAVSSSIHLRGAFILVYVQYHYSVPGKIINVGRSHCFEGRSDNLQRNYYSLQQMENKETQSRAAERGEEPMSGAERTI